MSNRIFLSDSLGGEEHELGPTSSD
jgi:hypothetical protein